MPKPKPKKKFKCLPLIKRAGLHTDPVFGKLTSFKDTSPKTLEWIRNRYHVACPGCGEWYYTSPGVCPVCLECRSALEGTGALNWWWKSRRTQRSLDTFLDTYFEGGYDVPEDPRQLGNWQATIKREETDDG